MSYPNAIEVCRAELFTKEVELRDRYPQALVDKGYHTWKREPRLPPFCIYKPWLCGHGFPANSNHIEWIKPFASPDYNFYNAWYNLWIDRWRCARLMLPCA